MRPSAMKRVSPSQRDSAYRMASASLVFWLIRPSLARSQGSNSSRRSAGSSLGGQRDARRRCGRGSRLRDVEPGDTFERLAGDRCGTGRGEFVEAPAHMGPAERQFNVTALGQDPIAGIAVDLEDAGKTREVDDRPFGLAIGSVDIGDGGRVCAAPGPVVAGIMTGRSSP